YAAYLGVPLSGPEGAPAGVLAVYARRPRAWRVEEIEALQALAGNTSAALANAELYSRVSLEKERSVAILANIADGIVAVDREGRVVLWNAAAEAITGVPAAEALNRAPSEVLQRELESPGDAPSGERLVSIRRENEEIWLSLTEAVMRDPAGAVAGRIFAFRDISAERVVEHMKREFVSNVSRELRSPLTSIYGFAETLLRDDVLFGDDERETFLRYITSEASRLTASVHSRSRGSTRATSRSPSRRPTSAPSSGRSSPTRSRRSAAGTSSCSTCLRTSSRPTPTATSCARSSRTWSRTRSSTHRTAAR